MNALKQIIGGLCLCAAMGSCAPAAQETASGTDTISVDVASVVKENIMTRRSIRKYTDQPLSPDSVKLILEAGLLAPSSKRCTPWEFIAVEDKEVLARLAACKTAGAKPVEGAALAIVVTADMTLTDTWVEDASIAAILMQLQAADLGLGSCWIQVRNRFGADDEPAEDIVRSILGIPETMGVLCILSIGHKDEERKPFDEEKMMWEKVHIGKWE